MKPLLLAIVPVLLLAGCRSSGGGPAPTATLSSALQSVQLRIGDVPAGFYRAGSSVLSADQAARSESVSPAQYHRAGGGTASAVRFVLKNPATMGITLIESEVFSFPSATAAGSGFRLLRTGLARSGAIGTTQEPVRVEPTPTLPATVVTGMHHPKEPPPVPYQAIHVPPVGAQTAGFTNDSASYAGEFVFTNRVILFLQGRYCAVVHISGDYAQTPVSAAVGLARRIDARIRASS
jgi:hypothetical protein